ncbi:MAG: nucleotidyltransferase family protein [Proteobacteria bacterium]|nr:nucleotidyltransferase family protein [Pseudomonadota bacterium]
MKTIDEIKEILVRHKKELRQIHRVKKIGIFGSVVRKEQKRGSDIDLLAEFEEPLSLLDIVGAEIYLRKILKAKVDLIPKEDLRPEIRKRILEETVYA